MERTPAGSLNISEIFYSFQGESTFMGRPTIFIRLSGCNLRCSICDTKYSLGSHKNLSISRILHLIGPFDTPYVCITGGEPLEQKSGVNELVKGLLKRKKIISIETNGSISIKDVSKRVKRVIDVKTPSTGEQKSFDLKNIRSITPYDEIKFVISDNNDFRFSIDFIRKHKLIKTGAVILFSPNLGSKGLARELVKWILGTKLNIMFQPQLHKLIKEEPLYIIK